MKRVGLDLLLLICFGLLSAACGPARPAFQPAATIVLAPDTSIAVASQDLEAARRVLQERLDRVSIGPSRVIAEGTTLKIELSRAEDAQMLARLVAQPRMIEFWGSSTAVEPNTATPSDVVPVITGLDISKARLEAGPERNSWQIAVEFTPTGTEKLAQFTRANVGQYLVLSSDRQAIVAPRIQGPINDGRALITGRFTRMEAESLAAAMNSGVLPVPLKVISMTETQ